MNYIDARKDELFKKYNIEPKNSTEEEEKLIYLLLYAYELAYKNSVKGNLTSSSYASGVVLEDGSVYFGVNFNNTRNEISSMCAERMAILSAFNNKIKEYNPKEKFDYKIKYILMTYFKKENIFWTDKITPCADCLSWFNTGKNLSADTKIVSLKKNKEGIYLDIQPLENFLPLRNLSYQVLDNIDNVEIIRSKNAEKNYIEDKKILELYKKTYEEYKNNNMAKTSGQNIAAGVLSNGEIFTGIKIDYSKRWFTEPLEIASIKAVEKYRDNTKIEAVCYVGEEYTITESGEKTKDGLISLQTLGRINTRFSNNETLVITSSKNRIEIRTIADYMPDKHKFIQDYEIK